MAYKSSLEFVGGSKDAPDYIYYNATIVDNSTTDSTIFGTPSLDPAIRFNETRDTAIVKNCADYHFSIIRFTMDGPNKDLPLFIPTIQEGTGQANVNLTNYGVALTYQQNWNVPLTGGTWLNNYTFTVIPSMRYVVYESETQNPTIAPTPRPMSAPTFKGLWSSATNYGQTDITSRNIYATNAADPYYAVGTYEKPFYQLTPPTVTWVATDTYPVGSYVSYDGMFYTRFGAGGGNGSPATTPSAWNLGVVGALFGPTGTYGSSIWTSVDDTLGSSQDLSTRYYWVYTYQHWLDLMNKTLGNSAGSAPYYSCISDVYNQFQTQWLAIPNVLAGSFPFANLQQFINSTFLPPTIQYSPTTNRFSIYGDTRAFGEYLGTGGLPFVVAPPNNFGSTSAATARLFFNQNTYGLFTNFSNIFWNTGNNTSIGPFAPNYPTPFGYTNEILFPNKFYQNVLDLLTDPTPSYLPTTPIDPHHYYWINEQDYISVDSLWSPIESLVFCSTLLPVKSEQTGQPVVLGNGNLGFSAPTTASAFQPIITDIAIDTSTSGAQGYRSFVYYVPTAEYRLADFSASKQDIRNIDVQVFWKCRLDNTLYPVTMFNLSSVSIKMLFRHKSVLAKSDR